MFSKNPRYGDLCGRRAVFLSNFFKFRDKLKVLVEVLVRKLGHDTSEVIWWEIGPGFDPK